MVKIGIYGGSFDPPHKGHRLLAESLAEFCGAEMVIVIPTAMSPFKTTSGASSQDRLNMCKLAFDSPLFQVSDLEIKRGGKSYTVDTLCQVKELYPDSQLFLFMGEDMLLSLDRWYKYEEILELCTPVAACRTQRLEKLSVMRDFVNEKLGGEGKAMVSSCVPVEISSTEIREELTNGGHSFIDEKVYEYIISRGLYNV